MVIDRIGNWAWALTPAERLVSVAVSAAQRDGTVVGARLARRFEAMRIKQAKLLARGYAASGPQGFGQASRRPSPSSPPPVADGAVSPPPASATWQDQAEEKSFDEPAD